VVVGDVNSTLAAALVAAKYGCLVAHVEAGLRSRDWRMPEEVNRVVVDRLSDYLFSPSEDAADNLRSEGYRDDQVTVVGNVMVDTLLANLDRALANGTLERFGLERGGYALATLHRPGNVDDPKSLADLVLAFNTIADRLPVVFPVHPRTMGALAEYELHPNISLLPPLGYLDFLALQAGARVVLTDSGGVQEETTALGTPCLTLRENTERPITVTDGTNRLVGRDPLKIIAAALSVIETPPAARKPAIWDGHAGERIAQVLLAGGRAADRARPTDIAWPQKRRRTAEAPRTVARSATN
jgi:UDP-N-acetylglucosamine 2-epimerase (non-hydrolysing)